MRKYANSAQKLAVARSNLMLPHPDGEANSIMHAFHECSLGLLNLDRNVLDDSVRAWLSRLDELMNTDDIEDPSGRGLWMVKAETLSTEEKIELSNIVDELASWFDHAE